MSMVMDETTTATNARTGLSKSHLLALAQCDRKHWLSVHRPELELVGDRSRQSFETGNLAGDLARRQAGPESGTMIDVRPHGWEEGLRRCRQALNESGPVLLFEAPFAVPGIGVLVDIVERDADGRLTLIEVKSASNIKNKPYVADAAIQAWTMAASGHPPIASCFA